MILLAATILGGVALRLVRPVAWYRALLNGFAASLFGIAVTWLTGADLPLPALVVPLLLFALPASLWELARSRDARAAVRVLIAWCAGSLPAAILLLSF